MRKERPWHYFWKAEKKENKGRKCSLDVDLGSVFFTAKSMVDYMKLKSIFTAKEIVNKMKRQGLPWWSL